MKRRARLLLSAALLSGLTLVHSFASYPRRWTVATFAEFLKGDAQGVSIASDGRLVPAPALDEILDTEEAFVHAIAFDRLGNIFVGTGSNGKVFRISRSGQAAELVDLDEPAVYALAVDRENRLYAATSPNGRVYRISSQGTAETFFDPDDRYIWALETDEAGNLFVGTGPKGLIYRVTPDGSDGEFYDSSETHVVTLARDISGNLLAGTSPGGLLFRFTPRGRPFVVYDSELKELSAITTDRYGNLFVAAIAESDREEGKAEPASSQTETGQGREGESKVEVSGTQSGGKVEVVRIDKDNLVERLYSSDDEIVFDLAARDDGSLLIATGPKGRIVSVDSQRFVTMLINTPEQQVVALLAVGDTVFAATSNLGKVFSIRARPAESGHYESEVLDAAIVSKWGLLRWAVVNPTSSGPLFFTRSGNTKLPDETWEDWQGPYSRSSGEAVKSGAARFLQWKVEFPPESRSDSLMSQTNAVEAVTLSYLQSNVAPVISELTVHPPGMGFVELPTMNQSGGVAAGGPGGAHLRSLPREVRELQPQPIEPPPRRVYIPGARSISWKAQDPNGDDLTFTLQCRRQGEERWRTLATDIEKDYFTLDGASLADGVYTARLIASDKASNPAEKGLERRVTSKPFVIANSPPTIEWGTPQVNGRDATMPFTATVSGGAVYQAEYAVDGGQWNIVYPSDGIADGEREAYVIQLENLTSGRRIIDVRVVDLIGNIATAQSEVVIP